jgi:hypothetical protein
MFRIMRQHLLFSTVTAVIAALCLSACSSKPTFPVRTYNLGERISLGVLTYTVFETQWLPRLGEEPAPRIPQSRFFLVRASIANGGSEDILSPNLTLEDAKGNVYQELSNGEGVPQWIGYLRRIKPAESAQGYLLFDVTPGEYNLRVLDESGEKAALVKIPLSFGSETPEIPAIRPAPPKQ